VLWPLSGARLTQKHRFHSHDCRLRNACSQESWGLWFHRGGMGAHRAVVTRLGIDTVIL
jgi:hypothetical protein